jgi:hypothetical protein
MCHARPGGDTKTSQWWKVESSIVKSRNHDDVISKVQWGKIQNNKTTIVKS